jgi:hypothetical protein
MTDTTNQNPGCIAGFLRFFGVGKAEKSTAKIERPTISVMPTPVEHQPPPFRLRDDFLSRAEISFYQVLLHVVDPQATICPKVRLSDIFYVSRPNENMSFLNKIHQKHVDFLLCNPDSMQPILGVELDDSSHKQAKQQERDELVDHVFASAGLPILHITAKAGYNAQELTVALAPYVRLNAAQPVSHQPVPVPKSAAPAAAPLCPKCGIPMVVRTVSKGEKLGKQFYGCRNYPNCRQMLPI